MTLAGVPSKRPVLLVGLIGGLLALTAGYLNAICLLFWDRSVTHATGLLTKTSTNILMDSLTDFFINLLQLCCFLMGAITSSSMVGAHRKFVGGLQYSPVLAVMGTIMLVISLLGVKGTAACLIVTFVAGMQNAMTTYFSGAIVRTTHVTGTLTDMGIEIAKIVRKIDERWWKVQVLTCFLLGFFFGGILGTLATLTTSSSVALIFPSIVYFGLAVGNYFYHLLHPKNDTKVTPEVESQSVVEQSEVEPKSVVEVV
mmetsp:Transcript_9374/g.12297  ORF Transcript_9374/g.12297 Transcript_9374/m.12297 type:complete len:256 (+) Transcript_9374:139-906(+)